MLILPSRSKGRYVVLDGAVTLLDASAGVEAQTLTVWRQADRYKVPCIAYLNKMDKSSASFSNCVQSMIDKLHVTPLITQVPVGSGVNFSGIVDIVNMEKYTWLNDGEGKVYQKTPVDASEGEMYNKTIAARIKLVENLANVDDAIAEHFLNDTDHMDIPKTDIHHAIRQATLDRKIVPVLCGSSHKNKGVQPLMDAIIKYLPCPLDIHHEFVEFYKGELCALAFKVIHDKYHGPLTFMRLYEGELKANSTVYNVNRECSERVVKVLRVYADEHKDIASATVGNIVAVSGLKATITGDTIVTNPAAVLFAENRSKKMKTRSTEDWDSDTKEAVAPVLAGMVIPDPVFFCSIEVGSLSHQKQLDLALNILTREDPSLRVQIDKDTGQTILSGMGELHLDIIKSRIEKEYKAEVYLGPLQIAYRESVTGPSKECVVTLDSMVGKDRHVVTVGLSVAPSSEEDFQSIIIPQDLDPTVVRLLHIIKLRAINAGVKSALSRGPILGYPMINVAVTLRTFQFKRGTSLSMVTGAASQAMFQALQQASSALLEPMMQMEIWTDEAYLSNILADLNPRRTQILGIDSPHPDTRTLQGLVPLAELRGYSTCLRTITSGRASFTMQLSHYVEMTEADQNHMTMQHAGLFPLS